MDRYFAEQRAAAALVGLGPQEVPDNGAAMRAYFEDVRPALGRSGRVRRGLGVPAAAAGASGAVAARELLWRRIADLA
ncbi:oxygenase MpaB family protein [Yinghuangia aomiensis]